MHCRSYERGYITILLTPWAEALSVFLGDQHLQYDLGMFHNSPKLSAFFILLHKVYYKDSRLCYILCIQTVHCVA